MGFLRKAVDDMKASLDAGQPERAAEINRIASENPRRKK